jgi:hypothetical protein
MRAMPFTRRERCGGRGDSDAWVDDVSRAANCRRVPSTTPDEADEALDPDDELEPEEEEDDVEADEREEAAERAVLGDGAEDRRPAATDDIGVEGAENIIAPGRRIEPTRARAAAARARIFSAAVAALESTSTHDISRARRVPSRASRAMSQRYIVPVLRGADGALTHAVLLRRRGVEGRADAWDVVALQDDPDGLHSRAGQVTSNPQTILLRNLERATVLLAAADKRPVASQSLRAVAEGGVPATVYLVTVAEQDARFVARALQELSSLAAPNAAPWASAQCFRIGAEGHRFQRRGAAISPAARSVLLHLGVALADLA